MKTNGGKHATRVLALAAVLLAGQAPLRAESAPIGGTLKVDAPSGDSMSAPFRPREDSARGDRGRSRNRREHSSSFLLRAPVFRWDSRVAQIVHVTGNGRLNMTRSRTYIKGYRVEDGFLIPVLGTVTDGVTFGAPEPSVPRTRSAGSGSDDLFPNLKEAKAPPAADAAENPPEPTVVEVRRPVGIHITSLVGTLKQNEDGELEFLAADISGNDIHYELLSPEPARKLLAEAGTDALRVILIGKVNDEDPRAAIRVTAAYALAAPAE